MRKSTADYVRDGDFDGAKRNAERVMRHVDAKGKNYTFHWSRDDLYHARRKHRIKGFREHIGKSK